MLINNSHKGWFLFFVLALWLSGAYYGYYHMESYEMGGNGPSGGSWTGLGFGIAGFVLMVFCGMLGLRRRIRIWRLGRAQTWLKAHIWLGLLSYPLIFFHSGLKWGNHLSFYIMVLFTIVIVSGIIGVILQQALPRYMLSRLSSEITFEQIPHVIEALRQEADAMVKKICGSLDLDTTAKDPDEETETIEELPGSGAKTHMKKEGAVRGKVVRKKPQRDAPAEGSEPLKAFYLREVRPFLEWKPRGPALRLATEQGSLALFEHTRTLIPGDLHDELEDLQSICEERREMALQLKLHFWLHAWIYVHVPLSYLLLALSAFHAFHATLNY